ncbi:MAG: HD domain-containing protein [Flavobacteriales bacterium]
MSKGKVFNDPIHGFISVKNPIDMALIDHPYFQRLRRISQLGLSYLVYPGAHHTRFHHALGAYHLMKLAVQSLREKNIDITLDEEEAVKRCILLHDIGHGPFSHALENSIVEGISHEEISLKLMHYFNQKYDAKLDLTIEMFQKRHPKKFLNELISSQLDIDRLDYLKRDSFFTGVSEGVINTDRLISMFNVVDHNLVIEQKAIYSVEKFILARRLMYWQVYLHKTVLAAELMLEGILKRAKLLAGQGVDLPSSPHLSFFLNEQLKRSDFDTKTVLDHFCSLDDVDVMASIKTWVNHPDHILSMLCERLLNRKLYKLQFFDDNETERFQTRKAELTKTIKASGADLEYYLFEGQLNQSIYDPQKDIIRMALKNGDLEPFGQSSKNINMGLLTGFNSKNYLCFSNSL